MCVLMFDARFQQSARKLRHVQCTQRSFFTDISLMSVVWNTSVVIFVFRLMTV
jgi:hypothetical protein